MATANPISDTPSSPAPPGSGLLVSVAPMPPEQLEGLFANLTESFSADDLLIATPNDPGPTAYPAVRIVPAPAPNGVLPLAAADFLTAYELAVAHDARSILILGPGSNSLSATAIRDLANGVLTSGQDLAVPYYTLSPHAGLVNSAILYPLTRALFGTRVRFPLALDLGLSLRMAERLAAAAQRFTRTNQGDALLWPVEEALVAGLSIEEFDVGERVLPQPAEPNVNAILALVTGSLFAEIESKAAFWQRPRRVPPTTRPLPGTAPVESPTDIGPLIEAFRLAYTNLQEIWSLVVAPNSLLALKRLSALEPAEFRMPENLWAHVIFDFLVAYRLRTINRGHLLGALIPLYLAWVAGHINAIGSGTIAELHIESVAAAFETEKPYLLSRWRWPDRFNP